jgi:hypothetical protein
MLDVLMIAGLAASFAAAALYIHACGRLVNPAP